MSILERIVADAIAARRAGNHVERDKLLFLVAEARKPGKNDGNRESTDAEVVGVIRKLIGSDEETITALAGTPREPEAMIFREDVARLAAYLPRQMHEAELTTLVTALMLGHEKSPKLIGTIMGQLRENHPGEFDPAMASRIIRALVHG